jgi:hypothetical protein
VKREHVFFDDLVATLRALDSGMPVTIFRTFPSLKAPLGKGLVRGVPIAPSLEEHSIVEGPANRSIDSARTLFKNVDVLDPAELVCNAVCNIAIDKTVYYVDDNHISAQGSFKFEAEILDRVRKR